MIFFTNAQELVATKKAELEKYESAIALVSQLIESGLLDEINAAYLSLVDYETEKAEFVKAVLAAVGQEISSKKAEPKLPDYNPPEILAVNERIGVSTNKFTGDLLYIGFVNKRSRNNSSAASVWGAFIEKNWKGSKTRTINSWDNCPIKYNYLLEVRGLNQDAIEEISNLDHQLLPETAMNKAAYSEPDEINLDANLLPQQTEIEEIQDKQKTSKIALSKRELDIIDEAREKVRLSESNGTNGSAELETVPF